jgi:hypothetical protein
MTTDRNGRECGAFHGDDILTCDHGAEGDMMRFHVEVDGIQEAHTDDMAEALMVAEYLRDVPPWYVRVGSVTITDGERILVYVKGA